MDPDRLARFVDRHAAALELYAAQWTANPADVVQEAFLELVRQDEAPERVVPWLYRVVRNGAISAARAESRRRRREQVTAERAPAWFVESGANSVDAREAAEALRELPDEQRETIVARLWGGLSFEEIGEVTGVSSSAAHRRYRAGLQALRNRLGLPCRTQDQSTTS